MKFPEPWKINVPVCLGSTYLGNICIFGTIKRVLKFFLYVMKHPNYTKETTKLYNSKFLKYILNRNFEITEINYPKLLKYFILGGKILCKQFPKI